MRKSRALLVLLPLVLNLFVMAVVFAPTSGTTAAEEWEDKGLEWYFDNLDDDDRRKIRQAMDYAIPRAQIIEGLHQGLAVPLATEVGQNVMGYDASVQPRSYNLTKSKALMKEVFGKEYSDSEDPNATFTDVPYFSMTLVCPTTNSARTQWGALIAKAFQDIGINVELKWWNWNIIMPRIYLDPIGVGYDYSHGGVDAWFVGMNANPDPDYSTEYMVSQFAPAGDNAFWVENTEVEEILNRSLQSTVLADRLAALSEFQEWFYEEVPKSIIRQGIDLFGVTADLEGFDPYLVGRGWAFNNYTIGSDTSMTYTVPGDYVDFNPLLSNSYYDFVPIAHVSGALTQRRGDYNLTHPVGQVAEKWTSSPDGLVWEVKIRDNIKWEDGTALTVDDVLFSYEASMDDDTGSPNQGFFLDRFPNNMSDIVKINDTSIRFTLGEFYPYVTTGVFGNAIIQKAQWSAIPFADWKTHALNTGSGTEYIKGFGPYKMTGFSVSTGVKLEKNPEFDEDLFGHNPTAEGGGIFMTNPTLSPIYVPVVKEATTAVAGLKAGTYQVTDSQTGIQGQFAEIEASTWGRVEQALEYGWQELSYNHYDARWGMNAHDPRELYPEDYAAAPFDVTGLLIALFCLAGFQVTMRKRRNN